MTNLMRSRANDIAFWIDTGAIILLIASIVAAVTVIACIKVPHDFGMYNNLKTICHVWKGRDGYQHQTTQHINSSKNIHESHPWDYDGGCAK